MSVIRHIYRLMYIDLLIRKKATGNLDLFAQKNRLSKRGLLNVLNDMKDMGFPIKYSRSLRSYYYYENGEMVKTLFIRNDSEVSKHVNALDSQISKLCFSPTIIFERCD